MRHASFLIVRNLLLTLMLLPALLVSAEPASDIDARPVAVITGSSYGLGKELVQRAVDRGWRVALVDVRPEPSQALVAEIEAAGGSALFFEVDLADPLQRMGLIARVVREYGRVDYLFNNAGYAYLATLEQMEAADARHLFEVNFWAYADLAQQVIPVMRSQGGGTILNVSSILGMRAAPVGYGHYSATKHALHGLFQSVMREVADDNIKVFVAAPGGMRTHVGKHSVGPMADPANDRAAKWEDPAVAADDIFEAIQGESGIFNPGAVGRRS